jgi:cytochrome P450
MTQIDWAAPEFPDIDFARDEVPNLPLLMNELRETGPFVPICFHGKVACLITRYADVKAAFMDEMTFPAAAAHREHTEPVLGPTMTTMIGEDHRSNRALVSPAFRPAVIQTKLAPLLEGLANELIDQFSLSNPVELMSQFTRPMAFRTITRYIGIPVEDEPQILDWGSKLLRFAWDPQPALDSARRLRTYLTTIVESRRLAEGNDLISELTRAEFMERHLDNSEIVTAILALFAAGIDGPANVLGSLLATVLKSPGLEARVREDPEIYPGLIEETLRFAPSPALMPRKCPQETLWRDTEFPANSSVIFGITPANRDPEAFPDPNRFDPNRHMDHSIMTFGQGLHLCLGSNLARSVMRIALLALLDRFPNIQLNDPGPVEIVGGVIRGPKTLRVTFGTRRQ